ncbi:N-methyl-L-tryptophan oxidase [Pseudomonas yamanorum]|uniref:N-methyl-L-tryptophan oxidase n=1 Tax=Pseudomonas yamanorum TaxID=515393 RepID=UPI0015A1BB68|nr:N-methyl-L-tryptophan oxidase [Pseudomonas yamanorum]NVZ84907.1 N-methyl-L-tryptophan oxidase [Pseudomonas yamanorum]
MPALHYDVAVIGLGAMGAATLYQLARRGVHVIGIDRFAPPHDQGSSHGDTRITRQAVGEGAAYVPLVIRSQQIWRELEAELDVSLFEQCGVLVMSSGEPAAPQHGIADFTRQTIALGKAYGIPHEVLNAEQIRGRFAQFAGLEDNAVGYFEPGGGYVKPERCIEAQLTLARQLGAETLTGAVVSQLQSDNGEVTISTETHTVRAGKVIVCAGMWSAELLGAPFDTLLTVCRQNLYWFKLAEPSVFPPNSPTFILAHGPGEDDNCYGFPPIAGEHSMKVACEQRAVATTPEAVNRQVSPAESDAMFSAHLAGKVGGVTSQVLKTAVCTYTLTPDYGFIIDQHPHLENVTVVSACSGHGFKHSAAIGEALAQQCVDGKSAIDLSAFSLRRFA